MDSTLSTQSITTKLLLHLTFLAKSFTLYRSSRTFSKQYVLLEGQNCALLEYQHNINTYKINDAFSCK